MNYIGSKKSLLSFLYEGITSITKGKKGVFLDGFAGTGSVGTFFQKKGFSIIANDIQYYSFIVNNGKLNIPQDTQKIKNLITELNELKGEKGFVYNNYCAGGTGEKNGQEWERLYFSDENGKKCDAVRMKIEEWKNNKSINEIEYYFLLFCLLEAIDSVANTASVYGAFLKKLKKTALKPLVIKPLFPENISDHVKEKNNTKAFVYNKKIEDVVLHASSDILYLDPPYNQRQYAPNYHVLETIALYDNPTLRGKTGLRDYTEQKSDFCNRIRAVEALENIVRCSSAKYIFLSYNNEGLMSEEEIQSVFSHYGESGFFTKDYARFKADKTENRNHTASKVVEYLHWVKKK